MATVCWPSPAPALGADTMTEIGDHQSAGTELRRSRWRRRPSTIATMVNLPAANTNGSIGVSLLTGKHSARPGAVGGAKRRQERDHLLAARHHGEPEAGRPSCRVSRFPYQESASSGATTTQFKNAVLSLKVTPLITPDNRVILDLDVSDDSVGQQVTSATGGSVPSIDTRRNHHPGAGQRRPDRGSRRHSRYHQVQVGQQGAVLRATSRCSAICSRARSISTTRPNC